MEKFDYEKEFTCGNTTITRADYENMPSPMNTSSLTDDDMQELAEQIEYEMSGEWGDWLEQGDVSQEQYDDHWWQIMEEFGVNYGMTYYEDEE